MRPAYIKEYLFCTQQSCLTLTLEQTIILYTGDPGLLETMQPLRSSSTAVALRSSSTAVPLRQLLFGSFSAAATGFRPLTPSQSFCDVKPLQPRQLACAPAWVQLLPRPLSPSRGPFCPHAAPAALMRPLAPSWGTCRPHTALIAVMRPFLPSWSFCDVKPLQPSQLACASAGVQLLLAAPAALMRPLPPPCGICCPHAALFAVTRPLLPSRLLPHNSSWWAVVCRYNQVFKSDPSSSCSWQQWTRWPRRLPS
jgi:hypothetical protein